MPDAAALPVLYEDAWLMAVEKPPGVSCETRDGTADVLALLGRPAFLIHRLDRETGGVLLLAKTREAAGRFSSLVADRALEKDYWAVTEGVPSPAVGECVDLLYHDARRNKSYAVKRPRRGVREARLTYSLLAAADTEAGPLGLVDVRLETGRTHQIRVQFAARGMPLYGDSRYGSRNRGADMALWCRRIALVHPFTSKALELCSRPPGVMPWTLFGDSLKSKKIRSD